MVDFEPKTRVGQPTGTTKYKKHVRNFEEGSPQEWIELLCDLDEIWMQNAISGAFDRTSSIHALIRGESGVTFDVALAAARMDAAGVIAMTMMDHMKTALDAVLLLVFLH